MLFVAGWLAGAVTAAPPLYLRTIGGPGHAELYPSGLDVDGLGNVYVADTGNDQIKMYNPAGELVWVVGTRRQRALGVFFNPRDVAYLDGKLYVADTGYNRIQVLDAATGAPGKEWPWLGSIMGVSAGTSDTGEPVVLVTIDTKHQVALYRPTGSLIRRIGTGPGNGNGLLNAPRDAATDSAGNVYVADYLNNRVAKFAFSGAWIKNWGGTGTSDGQFVRPYGMAVDDEDGVYVADGNNGRIQKFDTEGRFLAKWGSLGTGPGQFSHLRRVAVGPGPAPNVYGADLWGSKIAEFNQLGTLVRTIGGTPAPDGLFNEATGLAVDDRVYVVDSVNQRIQRFATSGTFELAFGHRGWGPDLLGFNWPRDVTTNAATNTVWLADTRNNQLKEFSRDGVPTGKVMGSWGTAVGKLNGVWGIASYGADLIVANTINNRVERWDTSTRTTTWATTGFSLPRDVAVAGDVVYVADTFNKRVVRLNASDGTVIDTFGQADLHQPSGVAVEENGEVWVSDSTWNRVVEFTPAGAFKRAIGWFGSAHGQFNNPTKVEVRQGELYIADEWNDRIEVFNANG